MHKEKSKSIFRSAGLPVAESVLVDIETAATSHPMALPYVVKPVAEGSSVGVHIVPVGANGPVTTLVKERHLYGDKVMVERFVPGKELTCAVMGEVALGVIEIVPRVGFYDYEAKYAPGASNHILPAPVPYDIYRRVQQYSLAAHVALGCRGVSRADFRYNDTPGRRERAHPARSQHPTGNDRNLAGARARPACGHSPSSSWCRGWSRMHRQADDGAT